MHMHKIYSCIKKYIKHIAMLYIIFLYIKNIRTLYIIQLYVFWLRRQPLSPQLEILWFYSYKARQHHAAFFFSRHSRILLVTKKSCGVGLTNSGPTSSNLGQGLISGSLGMPAKFGVDYFNCVRVLECSACSLKSYRKRTQQHSLLRKNNKACGSVQLANVIRVLYSSYKLVL